MRRAASLQYTKEYIYTKGCHSTKCAEIIPSEPDADNAAEGIVAHAVRCPYMMPTAMNLGRSCTAAKSA